MKKTILTLALISTAALGACNTTQGMGNKQLLGTGGGAVLGGLAGSQVGGGSGRLWATGAGVLLGALLGSEIGSSLDRADQRICNKPTRARTLPQLARRSAGTTLNPETTGRLRRLVRVRDTAVAFAANSTRRSTSAENRNPVMVRRASNPMVLGRLSASYYEFEKAAGRGLFYLSFLSVQLVVAPAAFVP